MWLPGRFPVRNSIRFWGDTAVVPRLAISARLVISALLSISVRLAWVHLIVIVFLSCLACGWSPDTALAASGPDVVRIRHFTAPDHTRVVLDLSGPSSFEVRRIGNPDRIAVNVSYGGFAEAGSIVVADGLVRRIRRNPGADRAQDSDTRARGYAHAGSSYPRPPAPSGRTRYLDLVEPQFRGHRRGTVFGLF